MFFEIFMDDPSLLAYSRRPRNARTPTIPRIRSRNIQFFILSQETGSQGGPSIDE